MEKRKNGVNAVEVAYLSLVWSLLFFILEFLLHYRKYNLTILVIKSPFSLSRTNSSLLWIYVFKTYEIWILGDLWVNILHVILSLINLSITNFPYEVGLPAGGLGIPDEV